MSFSKTIHLEKGIYGQVSQIRIEKRFLVKILVTDVLPQTLNQSNYLPYGFDISLHE